MLWNNKRLQLTVFLEGSDINSFSWNSSNNYSLNKPTLETHTKTAIVTNVQFYVDTQFTSQLC